MGHEPLQGAKELLLGLGPALARPAGQWGRQGHGVPERGLGRGLVPAATHARGSAGKPELSGDVMGRGRVCLLSPLGRGRAADTRGARA